MADGKRSSNWAFLVYPDSAPDGWMDILASNHISMMISPKHSPDGEAKGEHEGNRKEHYHVQLFFETLKSKEQVEEIVKQVNGAMPIKIKSARGYARYLTHLDSPEKEQFPYGTKPTIFGDLDYFKLIESSADAQKLTREMMEFIRKHDIRSFDTVADYSARYNDAWFDILTNKRTLFIKEYLKSRTWRKDRKDFCIDNELDAIEIIYKREIGQYENKQPEDQEEHNDRD